MMNLGRVFLFYSCITIISIAEPSVYGKNNGFYNVDKELIKHKKIIATLRQKILEQNERIDGIMSIVEGLTSTINELKKIQNTKAVSNGSSDTVLLEELGQMIDKINENYVSKTDLQKMLHNVPPVKTNATIKKVDTTVKKVEHKVTNKTVKELYSEAVRLFVKHRYDEAKKRFLITDTKGYKTAASNYYLGEISYYTKKYEDSIFYFKKSAGLYDKASYIDTLLLHTAISLQKSGKKEQAKVFYENIIDNYPDKKTATIAKDKLKTL